MGEPSLARSVACRSPAQTDGQTKRVCIVFIGFGMCRWFATHDRELCILFNRFSFVAVVLVAFFEGKHFSRREFISARQEIVVARLMHVFRQGPFPSSPRNTSTIRNCIVDCVLGPE